MVLIFPAMHATIILTPVHYKFRTGIYIVESYSINFLVAATGNTSVGEMGRKRLLRFAFIDSLAYSIFLLVGAIMRIRFFVSYEGFMAFMGGNFVLIINLSVLFCLNLNHHFISCKKSGHPGWVVTGNDEITLGLHSFFFQPCTKV